MYFVVCGCFCARLDAACHHAAALAAAVVRTTTVVETTLVCVCGACESRAPGQDRVSESLRCMIFWCLRSACLMRVSLGAGVQAGSVMFVYLCDYQKLLFEYGAERTIAWVNTIFVQMDTTITRRNSSSVPDRLLICLAVSLSLFLFFSCCCCSVSPLPAPLSRTTLSLSQCASFFPVPLLLMFPTSLVQTVNQSQPKEFPFFYIQRWTCWPAHVRVHVRVDTHTTLTEGCALRVRGVCRTLTKVETFNGCLMFFSAARPHHADECLDLAVELLLGSNASPRPDGRPTTLLLGISSGEVTAGVLGNNSPRCPLPSFLPLLPDSSRLSALPFVPSCRGLVCLSPASSSLPTAPRLCAGDTHSPPTSPVSSFFSPLPASTLRIHTALFPSPSPAYQLTCTWCVCRWRVREGEIWSEGSEGRRNSVGAGVEAATVLVMTMAMLAAAGQWRRWRRWR